MESFFAEPNIQIVIRLILASALGAVVGIEREFVGKSAGLRTFMLVSLGSCLFTAISLFGVDRLVAGGLADDSFRYNYDPTRIVSQIVVGIGFIGGGLIIFRGFRIEGLTTAAGLWTSAAIGTAVGFGFYLVASFSAVLTLFIFYFMKRMEPRNHPADNSLPQ